MTTAWYPQHRAAVPALYVYFIFICADAPVSFVSGVIYSLLLFPRLPSGSAAASRWCAPPPLVGDIMGDVYNAVFSNSSTVENVRNNALSAGAILVETAFRNI